MYILYCKLCNSHYPKELFHLAATSHVSSDLNAQPSTEKREISKVALRILQCEWDGAHIHNELRHIYIYLLCALRRVATCLWVSWKRDGGGLTAGRSFRKLMHIYIYIECVNAHMFAKWGTYGGHKQQVSEYV